MKLLRRLFCLLVVVLFFIAGVCVADKQFFAQNVIGIYVLGDEHEAQALREFIDGLEYEGAEDLCARLASSGRVAQASRKRMYFDTCVLENGVIPAGVYDTVCVRLVNNRTDNVGYSTLTGYRFSDADSAVTKILQKSYVSVLAFIGKLDRLVLNK